MTSEISYNNDNTSKLTVFDNIMKIQLYSGSFLVSCGLDPKLHHKLNIRCGSQQRDYNVPKDNPNVRVPLNMGNGLYTVTLLQKVSDTQYKPLETQSVEIKLKSLTQPYLEPNQYVNYQDTKLFLQLAKSISHDPIKLAQNYITKNIKYDHAEARTVKIGYLPEIEEIIQTKKGICFDIAALFAALLRYNNIPCRLMIGYVDKNYHAWNEVWANNSWDRIDLTIEITRYKAKQYVTEKMY